MWVVFPLGTWAIEKKGPFCLLSLGPCVNVQTCHIVPCPKFNQIVLLMQILSSAVGTHRAIGQISALIFPWVFNITKANWLSKLMENHVFGEKRRETKSKVFQHTVWFCTIQQNSSCSWRQSTSCSTSLKLLLKDNAHSTWLYYIRMTLF